MVGLNLTCLRVVDLNTKESEQVQPKERQGRAAIRKGNQTTDTAAGNIAQPDKGRREEILNTIAKTNEDNLRQRKYEAKLLVNEAKISRLEKFLKLADPDDPRIKEVRNQLLNCLLVDVAADEDVAVSGSISVPIPTPLRAGTNLRDDLHSKDSGTTDESNTPEEGADPAVGLGGFNGRGSDDDVPPLNCCSCGKEAGDAHKCPTCTRNMHPFCGKGQGEEGYGQEILCRYCDHANHANGRKSAQKRPATAQLQPTATVQPARARRVNAGVPSKNDGTNRYGVVTDIVEI